MNDFSFSGTSYRNMAGVNDKLVQVAELALSYSHYDFGIPKTGGVRTAEEQLKLYNDGKSTLNGYAKRSKHQDGIALDVFAWVDGRVSYDPLHLTHIAACFFKAANNLNVELQWGGFWRSFQDMPHFEVIE